MILTCGNCSTQFSIPDGALGARGRKVKCSRCSHSWFQAPDPSEIPETAETTPLEAIPSVESESLTPEPRAAAPVFTPPPPVYAPAPPALKITTALLALFMVMGGALAAVSFLGLSNFGMADTSKFAFQDMSFTSTPLESGKIALGFSGLVRNDAATTRPSPIVTVILYDRAGREMRALEYEFPIASIEAGKTIPFEPKINNIPNSLSRVVLELGNGLEQTLR